MSDVERPTDDPLAELQAQHELHDKRHRAWATTCDPERFPVCGWLALCDRLVAAAGREQEAGAEHKPCGPGSGCHHSCPFCHVCRVPAHLCLATRLAAAEQERDRYQAEFSRAVDLLHAAERQRDKAAAALEHRVALTHPEWMSEVGKAFRERFAYRPEINTLTPLGFFEAGAEWAAAIAPQPVTEAP